MPSRPLRGDELPRPAVTAVLVAHNGAAWLPECLAALRRQIRPPEQVVAVDTGSEDDTPRLLAAALGEAQVQRLARDAGFGATVQAGIDAAGEDAGPDGPVEWVWLLHDDCAPEPGALDRLLALAEQVPSAGVIGPKCRSWDGRCVTEVGLSTDFAGRRHTGVERAELDQGQHDTVRDVLAVGSAGALVRRDVWDRLGGYDAALPLLRDDLDFGWRATQAGVRVLVAPDAVVRHVAALGIGARRPDAARGSLRRTARRHGLYVVLANVTAARLPAAALRLMLGVVVRSLGLLAIRRPAAAYDEAAALLALVGSAGRLRSARRARRPLRTTPAAARALLAGPGTRVRAMRESWLSVVGRPRGRRRSRWGGVRGPVGETGPVAEESEDLDLSGTGLLRWVATRPGVLLAAALVVIALVAERGLLVGTLHGGRLLPAPAGASDLWSAYLSTWHPVGPGSAATAPPYLVPLALMSTVLGGKPWLAVDLLVLGAVPLAGLSAYLSLGRVVRSRALRCWAAGTYAVLPVVTGAVAGGRLGVCVATVLLPPVLAGGARVLRRDPRRSGFAPAFATGLVLAVAVAFDPPLYLLAATLAAGGALAGLLGTFRSGEGGRRPAGEAGRRLAAAVVMFAVPLAVLLPWTLDVIGSPSVLATGLGASTSTSAARPVGGAALVLAWPGGPGLAPWWLFAPLAAAGLAGVFRRRRRLTAVAGWWVGGVGLTAAIVLSRLAVHVPGGGTQRPWPGAATALTGAGLLVAALVAADGAGLRLRRMSFGWGQPIAAATVVLAGLVPLAAAGTWLARGAGGPVESGSTSVVPAFVRASMRSPARPRVLVLRRAPDGAVRYALLRRPEGPTLGRTAFAPAAGQRSALSGTVRGLVAGDGSDASTRLAAYAVRWVLVTEPQASPRLTARLDRVRGLTRSPTRAATLWQVRPQGSELAVLAPPAARAAEAGGTSARAARSVGRMLPSHADGARVPLHAGPAGRVVALAEATSPGWSATIGGKPLRPVRLHGWAQGFRVPAGRGGELVVRHDRGRRHAWLWTELGLAVLCAFGAVPGPRRDRRAEMAAPPSERFRPAAPETPAGADGGAAASASETAVQRTHS